jgi:pyruvate,water dikinase
MFRALRPLGVRVPDGFAITAAGYWALLEKTALRSRIAELLSGLDKTNLTDLARRGKAVRDLILAAEIPQALWAEIEDAYTRLGVEATAAGAVAVRSSATAEDLPTATFAGQQETFLNVRGRDALRQAIGGCFASLFTDRAISYRMDCGFGHLDVALSIAVQKMVRSDLAASGVMFTLDTETGFREALLIEGAWGPMSSRAPSTRTSSVSSSRRCAPASGRSCAAAWGPSSCAWYMVPAAPGPVPATSRYPSPSADGSA